MPRGYAKHPRAPRKPARGSRKLQAVSPSSNQAEADTFQSAMLALVREHLYHKGPDSSKSLLGNPDEFPPIPRCNKVKALYKIVHDDHDLYCKIIAAIMIGASPHSAFMFGYVHPELFTLWLRAGCADVKDGVDSYESRLFNDVQYALAVASIGAECQVYADDSLEWLRSGPGRLVHSQTGNWQANLAGDSLEVAQETGLATVTIDAEDGSISMENAPTLNDLPEAILALQSAGLGHVIETSLQEAQNRNHSRNGSTHSEERESASSSASSRNGKP